MLHRSTFKGIAYLTFAFAIGACTESSTNPVDGGDFNPARTSNELEPVIAVFNSATMSSFTVLGSEFAPPAATSAVAPIQALAAATHEAPSSFHERAARAAQEMALNLSTSAQAELIPQEYWGTTFVYVPGQGYQVDGQRTDAPEMGMRFVLYAVDPVTDQVVEPLVETGSVDFIDESTESSVAVRLVVMSSDVTYLNYSVTASGVFNAPVFTIEGFATDGVERVDFVLTNAIIVTFAGTRIDIDYTIDVANHDVRIAVSASLDANEGGGSLAVDGTITHEGQSVRVQGDVSLDGSDSAQLQVTANGSLFATVTIGPSSISAIGADGQPLSQAEVDALEEIFDVLGDAFDAFESLLDPVEWLFPGD